MQLPDVRRSLAIPLSLARLSSFFFFNDTATTEIYTLSLHDALPISAALASDAQCASAPSRPPKSAPLPLPTDRKSTRLNSSHANISYAVFCLKKKKIQMTLPHVQAHSTHHALSTHEVTRVSCG